MITEQSVNIVLVLGFIFIIFPFLAACFIKAYRGGFIPRIGKKDK